jgi:hypothetical protein
LVFPATLTYAPHIARIAVSLATWSRTVIAPI